MKLFTKLWKAHTEIHEFGAKGHPKCDECGKIESRRDALEERRDEAAVELKKDLDIDQAEHDLDHRGERDYASDIWSKAESFPERVTALNFDAPTEEEFDVPVQRRMNRDVVKSLEGMRKWSSKIMGVMSSGWGMIAFVTRAGLGSGPNLTCTVLYLTLLAMDDGTVQTLGDRLNALMDNTSGDNKNNETVEFLAWMVDENHFADSSFFCQIKGHTFTIIDQSFNTMISQMKQEIIYCISKLLSLIFRFLRPYGCREVRELHQLWDWKAKFAPHCQRFKGFCTGQFGSGMHEVYIRKDAEGVTRAWFRKSSKASTWFPEGPGYQVFDTKPGPDPPPVAPAKADGRWGRNAVVRSATVRSWFRYMAVESAESVRIREEWEARFDALPPEGDTTQLPDSMQLKWKSLRKRNAPVAKDGEGVRTLGRAVSGALENPPINPIVGPGHTEAERAAELKQYKAYMRGLQARKYEALFQADYVFLRLPSKPLSLHRVCSGLFIEDSIAPDITFQSLAYSLLPATEQTASGFWGLFEAEDNQMHDPNDKRKGTIFVRHGEVDR